MGNGWFWCPDLQERVMWNSQEGSINLTGRKRSQSLLYFCVCGFEGKIFASSFAVQHLCSWETIRCLLWSQDVSVWFMRASITNHKHFSGIYNVYPLWCCHGCILLSFVAFTHFEENLFCCWFYLFSLNSSEFFDDQFSTKHRPKFAKLGGI